MKLGRIRSKTLSAETAEDLDAAIQAFVAAHPQSELVGDPIGVGELAVTIFYVLMDRV